MRRLNINIDGDTTDERAAAAVLAVIGEGRISGDEDTYCYVTTFRDGLRVSARRTRAGHDTFTVWHRDSEGRA